jgi:hypothetical protein
MLGWLIRRPQETYLPALGRPFVRDDNETRWAFIHARRVRENSGKRQTFLFTTANDFLPREVRCTQCGHKVTVSPRALGRGRNPTDTTAVYI